MLQKATTPAIKIEKGIALPSPKNGGGRPRIYPLDKMEVGDSFFVARELTSMGSIVTAFRKHCPNRKFTKRTVEGGTRIWRIA